MKTDLEMLVVIAALGAAYFLFFRKAGAMTLTNSQAMVSPAPQANMTPAPATVPSNSTTTIAQKVATYGNTGEIMGDWSY